MKINLKQNWRDILKPLSKISKYIWKSCIISALEESEKDAIGMWSS